MRKLVGYVDVLPVILGLAWSTAGAQAKQILFDGKSLAGWHIQGEGLWTVKDGAIHGSNPKKIWAHLISDRPFADGVVRLKYLNTFGNSGLYVRGSEGGSYKMKGMQVDFGTRWDGAVMRVNESDWEWLEEVTRASDSGWAKNGVWNEVAVDMQGNGLKTYINGRLVWQGAQLAGMAAAGLFGLQLHGGDANEIAFKDIEFQPTPTGIIAPVSAVPARGAHSGLPILFLAPQGGRFDLKGARLPAKLFQQQGE